MLVVDAVESAQIGELVKSEVEPEEDCIVDDDAGQELENKLSACWWREGKCPSGLQRRVPCKSMQRRGKKIPFHSDLVRIVVTAQGNVIDRDTTELLDHCEVHEQERYDVCKPFSYAVLRPLHLRRRFGGHAIFLNEKAQFGTMVKSIRV